MRFSEPNDGLHKPASAIVSFPARMFEAQRLPRLSLGR